MENQQMNRTEIEMYVWRETAAYTCYRCLGGFLVKDGDDGTWQARWTRPADDDALWDEKEFKPRATPQEAFADLQESGVKLDLNEPIVVLPHTRRSIGRYAEDMSQDLGYEVNLSQALEDIVAGWGKHLMAMRKRQRARKEGIAVAAPLPQLVGPFTARSNEADGFEIADANDIVAIWCRGTELAERVVGLLNLAHAK
jgi:hypothetical protein